MIAYNYSRMDRIKELKFRYKKSLIKVEHENEIIKRSRDRKRYWQGQAKLIKGDLKLLIEGQLEFPF